MNIITNPTEVATVLSLVTSQVLDGIALSEKAKDCGNWNERQSISL